MGWDGRALVTAISDDGLRGSKNEERLDAQEHIGVPESIG